ncbi:ABC transporter substrate-binding protein [Phytohabitans sp. ZYX-F-186]|uniref:ABC transporter substrate-binding protein n=1 Tax=Phytohabitans maris TaxID=3071409 RepID=A0ABU0Z8H8_9ACTN|nr:ABC transporter substrate-binding protein [Phytohabitans sp. ZYX-F-186]MDQ7903344.1 ABC transporter substrate-binding protein [Phytohabitans sp. ZYX-F-186]
MRPIRSVTLSALTAAALVLSASACQSGEDAGDVEEVIIGADLELSGPTAAIGEAYRRALELKISQVNDSGILGNRKLRLDPKDNRSDSSRSLTNVGAFANNPNVAAVVMGTCAECVERVAETVKDRRVPTIALAPAGGVVAPVKDRQWVFKIGPNAADNAAALAREINAAKKKRVGLLYTNDLYGKEGLAAIRGALGESNVTATAVRPTDTDVSQAMETLLAESAEPVEAIVVWTFAEQAALAAASAQQAGFKGPIYFDGAAAGDLFLAGQKATNGATMVFTQTMVIDDVIATTPATAARKQWFRDYTAKYGSYYGFSSFAADAVQMVANALQQSSTVSRDSIRSIVETSQFDGLSGPIRITPDNHSGLMPQALTVLVARNGRWRLATG